MCDMFFTTLSQELLDLIIDFAGNISTGTFECSKNELL